MSLASCGSAGFEEDNPKALASSPHPDDLAAGFVDGFLGSSATGSGAEGELAFEDSADLELPDASAPDLSSAASTFFSSDASAPSKLARKLQWFFSSGIDESLSGVERMDGMVGDGRRITYEPPHDRNEPRSISAWAVCVKSSTGNGLRDPITARFVRTS